MRREWGNPGLGGQLPYHFARGPAFSIGLGFSVQISVWIRSLKNAKTGSAYQTP